MKPRVSIIVPCYNEQATIRFLLDAILAQTYPPSMIEVIIADSESEDKTREVIASIKNKHPDLSLCIVDNKPRTIPAGLNLAIKASSGEIIVRLDAHSVPIPEYVERCVEALEAGKGTNVGGVWEIHPGGKGWMAAAIAVAAAHPLGVGDAQYRLASKAGPVDTVPFGAFRRDLIDHIGGFDETLLTNEDYEFNTRIRQAGGTVWLDPQIRSVYFARSTFIELAKQYWRYGFWKFAMLRRYPNTIRWRQALPPFFVLSLIAFACLSLFWHFVLIIFFSELIFYLLILTAAALVSAIQRQDFWLGPGLILAIATMHLSWGGGFLWSMVSSPLR